MIEHVGGAVIPTGFDVPVEPLRRAAHYTGEPGCIAEARSFAAHFVGRLRTEWCAKIVPTDPPSSIRRSNSSSSGSGGGMRPAARAARTRSIVRPSNRSFAAERSALMSMREGAEVSLRALVAEDSLSIELHGVGLDEEHLERLRDRVEALNGSIEGGGETVRAVLPIGI